MFMGFILHIYIIFGTNLLTGGPARIAVFCLFQYFQEKEYQMESKRNEIFGNVIFSTNMIHGTWSVRHKNKGGRHEAGGRALHPRGLLDCFLTCTPIPPDHVCSKKIAPEGFIPFGLRLIFLFFETLKQAKKTAIRVGPPVSRLVPKMV